MIAQKKLSKILSKDQLRETHLLKQKIKDYGLKQVDIAYALNCSTPELSKWLNNRIIMPWSAERRIEEILTKLDVEEVDNE